LNLRNAKSEDLKTIISWIPDEDTCKLWAGPQVRFPLNIESLSKDIEFSDNNSFCLIDNESIVAFGQLLEKENGYLHLARIIVAPSKRAMGYGRSLCNALLKITRQRGCGKISLNVYQNNTNAFKLYEKLGFRKISEKSSKEICHMILENTKRFICTMS
jgi:ribosomal protein S18 acetylase RimI-like enzyme